MSRSYKKIPGFSNSEFYRVKRYYLRLMNRRIRRLDPFEERQSLPDGNHYRRYIEAGLSCDYRWRCFSPEILKDSWYGRKGVEYRAIRK